MLLIAVLLYAALVAALVVAGRRREARAWAGFVPDCVVLVGRLLRDGRVPRRRKLLLAALVAYLAVPIDLVPDVIPVAGQLDDAILVALVLRSLVRAGGADIVAALWPGPPQSLAVVLRLAGAPPYAGAGFGSDSSARSARSISSSGSSTSSSRPER